MVRFFKKASSNSGAVDTKQKLTRLDDIPQSSIGAPIPMASASEHALCLVYYTETGTYDDQGLPINESGDPISTADIKIMDEDATDEVAKIVFNRPYIHSFGPPNDEAIAGHPLYQIGLEPYDAVVVENSEWIADLVRINSVHPYHKDEAFAGFRHYIFTFHDSTFEVVANGYDVSVHPQTSVKSVLLEETAREDHD